VGLVEVASEMLLSKGQALWNFAKPQFQPSRGRRVIVGPEVVLSANVVERGRSGVIEVAPVTVDSGRQLSKQCW
jgi:hypothetical protein